MKTQIEITGERLKKVIEGFNAIKTFGLDEDILICYLRVKTKMNEKNIKLMLKFQNEFINKLMAYPSAVNITTAVAGQMP